MDRCFVIQPFDNDKFDKRFTDVYEPAIIKAGLEPYRVDKDFSVRIPIDDIEKEISESIICFADITLDNPNVWYELGFAFACQKNVVMVCSDERPAGKFPFDIQHRQIITYKTGSTSDFNLLASNITQKIEALLKKNQTVKTLNTTPVLDKEGLKSHEIALLLLIIQDQYSNIDSVSINGLKHEMDKSGYNAIATSIGIRSLKNSGFIETVSAVDEYNNQQYTACRLTPIGEEWVLKNQHKFEFRKSEKDKTEDELPF